MRPLPEHVAASGSGQARQTGLSPAEFFEAISDRNRRVPDNIGATVAAASSNNNSQASSASSGPRIGRPTARRSSAHPPRRAGTPAGAPSRGREDSVQRHKADRARPGSRRERRWLNRTQLTPTAEDLAGERDAPLGADATRGLFDSVLSGEQNDALRAWVEGEAVGLGAHAERRPGGGDGTTPAACLRRVDRTTRRALLRYPRVPVGVVERFERDVRHAFAVDPDCTYVAREPNSFNRCLLHAVCQYLGLESRSETVCDGDRITLVTAPAGAEFSPPTHALSALLMEGRERCGVQADTSWHAHAHAGGSACATE